MTDEELQGILTNTELDDTAKMKEIKTLVGNSFIPKSKYDDQQTKSKENYDALQKEFNDFKKSKMTEEELKQSEYEAMKTELQAHKLNTAKARATAVFAEAGLVQEDYGTFLDSIVTEDSEKTEQLAKAIASTISKRIEGTKQDFKEKIIKSTKQPEAGESGSTQSTLKEQYQKAYMEASKKGNFADMAYYTRLLNELKN